MLKFSLPLISALVTVPALAADTPPPPDARPAAVPAARGPALELAVQAARTAIEACAANGGQKTAASVVDSAGILKALLAYDGTSQRGVQSSTNKAVTALTFKAATSQLGERAKADKAFADQVAADTKLNVRPGGVLIKSGDEIVGAIGVGGGKTDEECALAGLQKIQGKL
jgi:uncharacterized protein GlcG (DUF336 family)